jgi:GT2 family glycosyltransferase
MSLPKVAVVILNWNGKKYLHDFLPSVMASTYPNIEVVVGDNASSDGSVQFLKENYPTISVLTNDQNYGFTGGYNRILSRVEADYYVLLNSDIEVVPGWIEPVVKLMESDDLIAAAAPKIKSFRQKTHFEHAGAAGGFIDKFGYPFCEGRIFFEIEEDKGQYEVSKEVFWGSGAALFIKKKYWDECRGFDERFFAHMEEIDLCWRLKNMGLKVMYCAESEVYHVGGGTLDTESPFKTYLNFRNNLVLLKKNLPFSRAIIIIPIRFIFDLMALLRFVTEGKYKNAWAVSKAHQNFVRRLFTKNITSVKSRHRNYNLKGMYNRSIVLDFFLRKKTHFIDLDPKDFL